MSSGHATMLTLHFFCGDTVATSACRAAQMDVRTLIPTRLCIVQVRAFRDRRYEYKGLVKTWKKKLGAANDQVRPALTSVPERLLERIVRPVLLKTLHAASRVILNAQHKLDW
jgi:hypothetical protein